jgi:TRAP-type uncharacterized transport system fused permease subunit
MEGYMCAPLKLWGRAMLAVGGLMFIDSNALTDFLGLAVVGTMVLFQFQKPR